MDIVTVNDVSAAITGATFASIYGGKASMQAVQSFVTSVIARMASQSETFKKLMVVDLGENQKNQLVVAILGAASAYWRKGSVLKGSFSSVAIDLIAEDAVRMLGLSNSALLSTNSVKGPAAATTSGTATSPP